MPGGFALSGSFPRRTSGPIRATTSLRVWRLPVVKVYRRTRLWFILLLSLLHYRSMCELRSVRQVDVAGFEHHGPSNYATHCLASGPRWRWWVRVSGSLCRRRRNALLLSMRLRLRFSLLLWWYRPWSRRYLSMRKNLTWWHKLLSPF
jgi:hypothetical protein